MTFDLSNIIAQLREHALTQAHDCEGEYQVAGQQITVKTDKVLQAVREVCPDSVTYPQDLQAWSNALKRYLPFASSPASMMLAWSWRESTLTSSAAIHLAEAGGVLIPAVPDDPILHPGQKGLVVEEGCLFAIRHSPGNYPDKCDINGRLTYQPTVNRTGPVNYRSLVRFRWAEYLSAAGLPGGTLLMVMWFKYPEMTSDRETVMMICPAVVESVTEPWSEGIGAPLQLRLVSRHEALAHSTTPLSEAAFAVMARP